ncbi:nucleotidyltransferase [Microbacterium phage Shocker]|uniref:Nucleotidyltransferase n=1 Tax=Microbacterium phage Shocker TaxID=2805839 RepID=A0A890UNB3_9CAUD|nr:nucleotidyltransferase [Microbacterium phage Shocker]QRI45095.1 nucleotidyltransferase [Microbacterium phage Shocker]
MSAFSPRQMFLLDLACKPIEEAIGATFHVGTSASGRQEYRDVDVRTILDDERYDALAAAVQHEGIAFLGLVIGQYLYSITGLPIDYQIQRQTEANALHSGSRNPLGVRDLSHFRGDAAGGAR